MKLEEQIRQIEPRQAGAPELVQLTDCHIFADPGQRLLGLDTRHSFETVLAAAIGGGAADLIILTGDLSQDGSAESYDYLAAQLGRIGAPVVWLPGNHDDPAVMATGLQAANIYPERLVAAGNWLIVLLDSTLAGEVHGRVADAQLDFMDAALAAHPEKHGLVCLHHQAQPTGSSWIDAKGLRDDERLRVRLGGHPNLRGVLWGHVHQEYRQNIDGVEWMSTPSTCVQFEPGSSEFSATEEAPGYRRLSLGADGVIDSRVERASGIEFDLDYSLRGY